MTTEAQLRQFLDDLEIQQFMISNALALESYYQWKGEARHFSGQLTAYLTDLQSRRDYAAIIDRWHGRVKDSTLARRLELHRIDFRMAKVPVRLPLALTDLQTWIQDSIGKFRYRVRDSSYTQTQVSQILSESDDRTLREAAYRARTQISPGLRAPTDRALSLIDQIGKAQGFSNGAAAYLDQIALTPQQVLADLDAFERATRPTYQAMIDRATRDLGVSKLEVWDMEYWLRRQELAAGNDAWPREQGVARLRELMLGIGFAFDSLPIDVKIWDVPTGGIAFPVRPAYEARLLSNPFNGVDFYSTLFHEYGHTANAVLMAPDLPPIFYRYDATPLSEGVAEALGHFASDRHWLQRAARVTPAQAARLEAVGKMQLLHWLRRTITMPAYVEITHYQQPRANLDSLNDATFERFALLTRPAGDYSSGRAFFATGPLYLQSYLYANMIAAQTRDAMRRDFQVEDLSAEPRVAEWLTRHFFRMGQAIPWPEKVRRATGSALSPESLARYLAGAVPPD